MNKANHSSSSKTCVCDALDLGNNREVARRLDEDCVSTADATDNLGRLRQTNVVTEAGLYDAIFMSRKPEAKAFKRWVTSEVLPSIRKHGMYATPATIEDMLANPDAMINALMRLKEERAARAKAEAEIEAQRPVAAPGKAIETAEGDLTPSAFGKTCRRPTRTWDPTSSAGGSSTTTSHSATAKARSSPRRTQSTEESPPSPNASTRPVRSGHSSSSHLQDSLTPRASSVHNTQGRGATPAVVLPPFLPSCLKQTAPHDAQSPAATAAPT